MRQNRKRLLLRSEKHDPAHAVIASKTRRIRKERPQLTTASACSRRFASLQETNDPRVSDQGETCRALAAWPSPPFFSTASSHFQDCGLLVPPWRGKEKKKKEELQEETSIARVQTANPRRERHKDRERGALFRFSFFQSLFPLLFLCLSFSCLRVSRGWFSHHETVLHTI